MGAAYGSGKTGTSSAPAHLTGLPEVFQANQHNRGQCPLAGFLDGFCQFGFWVDESVDDPGHVGVINPNRPCYIGLGQPNGLETILESPHALKFVSKSQRAQGESYGKFATMIQTGDAMEKPTRTTNSGWTYRDAFDTQYRAYIDRTGQNAQEVAELLGVAVDTLHSYRRKTNATEPKPETLVKAAQLFGCSIYAFMPNWGLIADAGVNPSELSPIDIHRVAEAARTLTDERARTAFASISPPRKRLTLRNVRV